MIEFFSQYAAQYGALFVHFAGLSLLSVGGAITLVPAMQQYLVAHTQWMSAAQFNAAVTISQAAPGPNILFVSLMGWYAGSGWLQSSMPQAHWGIKLAIGVVTAWVALLGMMLPSTTLNYFAGRWAHHNQHRLWVKAFKQGMAPIVIGLLIATGWVLAASGTAALSDGRQAAAAWLLTACAALLAWRTSVHLLYLLAAGALAGALGWV